MLITRKFCLSHSESTEKKMAFTKNIQNFASLHILYNNLSTKDYIFDIWPARKVLNSVQKIQPRSRQAVGARGLKFKIQKYSRAAVLALMTSKTSKAFFALRHKLPNIQCKFQTVNFLIVMALTLPPLQLLALKGIQMTNFDKS